MSATLAPPRSTTVRLPARRPTSPDLRRRSLLDLEPELGAGIPVEEWEQARRATTVATAELWRGPFDPTLLRPASGAFGAIVVDGLLSREVSVQGQAALRMLGPGDAFVVGPAEPDPDREASWSALAPARIALLDRRFVAAAQIWPALVHGILGRLQQCHDTTLELLSICHLPRVEDRIDALFRLVGARWGRVTPQGIVVPVALTHDVIGRMVGARRPTVTLALGRLAEQGRLSRVANDRWLLGGDLVT